MQLLGGNPAAQASGVDRLPGVVNYFIGNDPSKWRTHISTFAQVEYQNVYPGVGLVYYGNQQQLEYDFQVAPGADPGQIRMGFAGAQSVSLDAGGDLLVQVGAQVLRQHQPVVYQEVAGERRDVAAGFVVQGLQVAFALGSYDPSKPLVIDPVLTYSTYIGGRGGDLGNAIAVDAADEAFITGTTGSPDFPTTSPLQPNLSGGSNAFVAKLAADGSALLYSTYLGGRGGESGNGIAVDAAGDGFVTGFTRSRDFPTVNPLQSANGGSQNAFVAKLAPDGSTLVYSTYLGGSGNSFSGDVGNAIALDGAGDAFVTGTTGSSNFPTANPLQSSIGGFGASTNAFVAELTPEGSALVYSTYLGGSGSDEGHGIAVDAEGDAVVTGFTGSPDFPTVKPLQPNLGSLFAINAFVAKLTPFGSALVYSTYLGGSHVDTALSIAVDAAGDAFVTGSTGSDNFPTSNALQATFRADTRNAFVAELTPDGSALVYSTYLGGKSDDNGVGIAVDAAGDAFVTGYTGSLDFPTVNALQTSHGGGQWDVFVAELTPGGSALVFSTYLGGSSNDLAQGIAVDTAGNAFVIGQTASSNFPTVNALQPAYGGGTTDAFVLKIGP
jgi:hypothetical protein